MKAFAVALGFAAALAALPLASSQTQPPQLPPGIPEGFVPEGAIIGDLYTCPDPAELQTQPECCRTTLDIDAEGTATRVDIKCTFAPLEPVMKQCQLSRKHEPQIGPSGPKAYSTTEYQEHYPAVRDPKDLLAMIPIAEKACASLR